ncbi:RNA-directed DNA polymerase from mobile element jockey [Eumeta japonica]|uniref:RNA-directed DNA polymerase from mobile element jockey n=1 Tax=Eumeta variegata TaxID=151549 RepID=A0A4C1SIU4_EUMVA|nr:RNA-directed DNA polymerase from mobile element jockey [Eumeta japonica]
MFAEHTDCDPNAGRRTVGIFLDIEKALDRVWHSELLYKLLANTQIPPALLRIVASFLERRNFFVAVEDATSDPRPIRARVPPGSCLSPCLCAVFTDDIPTLSQANCRTERRMSCSHYMRTIVFTQYHVVGLTSQWLCSREQSREEHAEPRSSSRRTPDEKTPGHEAIVSPLSRTCDHKRSRMTDERNVSTGICHFMTQVSLTRRCPGSSQGSCPYLRPQGCR